MSIFPIQPLPLISRGGTSTIINCVYIGMMLSISRYAAKVEEEKARQEALLLQAVPAQAGAGGDEASAAMPAADSEAQTAAEPTAKILNSDEVFE